MNGNLQLGKVRVVSWDIDGTMYGLPQLMRAFKRDLVRRMFSRHWLRAWADFFRLLRFKRYMDKVRARAGDYSVGVVPRRDAIAQTQEEMYGRILPAIGRLEGVEPLMAWFRDAGLTQVAFSDYRPSSKLKALGVDHYFEEVYAGEDIGHLKPSPVPFRHILEAHKLEPEELLHIGDRTDTDGAASDQVGYQVAIIGHHHDTATSLLHALQDIGEHSE